MFYFTLVLIKLYLVPESANITMILLLNILKKNFTLNCLEFNDKSAGHLDAFDITSAQYHFLLGSLLFQGFCLRSEFRGSTHAGLYQNPSNMSVIKTEF